MSKQDEYRDSAAQMFGLAARTSSSNDKSHLLDLAEKWLDLADRSRQQATPSAHRASVGETSFPTSPIGVLEGSYARPVLSGTTSATGRPAIAAAICSLPDQLVECAHWIIGTAYVAGRPAPDLEFSSS